VGLAWEDFLAFREIAEEEGVLIGVRGRSPISVKNLEQGAVWKHENLKPKNVNSIDVEYLGFPSADQGMVAFRTYTAEEKQEIARRIFTLNVSTAERDVIASRAATRFGEAKYLSKIEGFAEKGEIDVGFNYADNGSKEENTSVLRGFALEHQPVSGGTYYRPYQENPALDYLADRQGSLPKDASLCIRKLVEAVMKLLCRVTGDTDGVYLTTPQGTALPEAKRVAVYNQLIAIGWQHPETLTWIKDGLFDFSDKTKILKGLELGGEAMMEFAPDGKVRSTYLNLAASTIAKKGTNVSNYFVGVLGGYTGYLKSLSSLTNFVLSPLATLRGGSRN
jgi:hypothetical protein